MTKLVTGVISQIEKSQCFFVRILTKKNVLFLINFTVQKKKKTKKTRIVTQTRLSSKIRLIKMKNNVGLKIYG